MKLHLTIKKQYIQNFGELPILVIPIMTQHGNRTSEKYLAHMFTMINFKSGPGARFSNDYLCMAYAVWSANDSSRNGPQSVNAAVALLLYCTKL